MPPRRLTFLNQLHLITDSIDNKLMFQVKAGDLHKMGLLFERHHRPLFTFFFYILKDRVTCEDLVQTVFMKMLKSRHTFTGVGKFETWMYCIARNILKDHYRKNNRQGVQVDADLVAELIPSEQVADQRLQKKEEWQWLSRALERLSETDREIVLLCRLQEIRYAEVARVMNMTEGAVKVRLHRAIRQLKEYFLESQQKTVEV